MNNKKNKIKKDDMCPCGSGKKYKHCHIGLTLPLEDLPKDNIYDLNKEGLGLMNMIFHFQAQVDMPLFEFCLDHDIYHFKNYTIFEQEEILKIFENNSLTVEKLFEIWKKNYNKGYLNRMLKNSINVNSKLFKKENQINQLLKSHFEENYYITIPLAFSIIEGLFRDYNQISFENNDKMVYKIKTEVLDDTMLYSDTLGLKYFSKFLNKLMSGKPATNTFHRNSVLHGVNDNYATEENSLLLIMTIFQFFQFESHNKYWPQKESYIKDGDTYINGYKVEMKK